MPLPSIGVRLCQLVGLMCLLVLLALSMLVLKSVDSHVHDSLSVVLRFDKALSSLEAYEQTALRDANGETPPEPPRIAETFKGQLTPDVEEMLTSRRDTFDHLLALTRRIENEHADVFFKLLEITKGVRYIHQHHVAYLQNLVNRMALFDHVEEDAPSKRNQNESAANELAMVQESLNIYTSLFDIHAVFFKLHQSGPEGVAELFGNYMGHFNKAINAFEDISFDAQDGLLIEELIIVGRSFEKSFSGLLDMETKRLALDKLLKENKAALHGLTQAYIIRQEAKARRTQAWSDILQPTFIATAGLLAIFLIANCSMLSKAVKQIASEAHKLKTDISHRVDESSARFGEFQAVFNTFNTMAGTLGRQMSQLSTMAFSDTLTGLPNRSLLLARMERAIAASRRDPDYLFAVLFLDLDRFKVINDSLGHECGDELLKTIGKALTECVRGCDTVARLGGDEFAILLEHLPSRRDVIHIVKGIQNRISQRVSVAGFGLTVQASIGISIRPEGQKPEDILRDADIAMYDAKKKGPGRFRVYTPRLGEQAVLALSMELDLRRAIERREIEVYFQPIVNMDNGRLHGLEALARWRHPTHGDIAPATFIRLAEETGLILPLGRHVLAQACHHASRWNQGRAPEEAVVVHVNLSPKQFCDAGLVQEVSRTLAKCGMPARLLNIEITESVLMASAINTGSIVNRLKDLGVGLSLDDFGTGYSSLGNLHHFPVDTFKIDRSFVSRLDRDKKTNAMIQMILALARALETQVIAEGVENADQEKRLRALGCRLGQGYYYSRPLSVADMEAFIEQTQVPWKRPA